MYRLLILAALLVTTSGCASLISSATSGMADNISGAILNQDDPATVRDGAPAYLLMLDGLIEGDPESEDLLLAGARLYGSYATAFVEDEERAQRLAARSLGYAHRALCNELPEVCAGTDLKLDEFRQSLAQTSRSDLALLYGYAVAWAGWVQLNSADWNAVADLAKVTALFEHCLQLDESFEQGGSHLYLGVIKSLLPAALGGKPEVARSHFESAIEISAGRNLMASVLMAQHYARAVFDQQLHDSLLNSVLAAEVQYAGYTLSNSLAKQQAAVLLAESADFF